MCGSFKSPGDDKAPNAAGKSLVFAVSGAARIEFGDPLGAGAVMEQVRADTPTAGELAQLAFLAGKGPLTRHRENKHYTLAGF